MAHELSETKILLVDNPTEIRNMKEALREVGFNNIAEMNSGLQVLTEIKKNPPAIIFCNCILPQYSGMQVFKSLQADRTLAGIKFVMVFARLSRREQEDMKKDGVVNMLQRPFPPEALRETIFGIFGMSVDALREIAQETLEEARVLFSEKNFETALAKFREAGNAFPSAECFFWQGRCYLEMSMPDQALAAFNNTMEQDRGYPQVDHWIGVAFQRKKDFNSSINVLERAVKRPEAIAETHVELGKSYLGADKVAEADNSFNTAIKMDPNNIANRTSIGNAYLEKELYNKAEAVFGAAIDINPDNLVLYNRMAIALRKQGKHQDAINLYIKALKIAPSDEGLYYNLSKALYHSGQKEKAIKCLDKALTLDPEFSEAVKLRKEYVAGLSQ